jgi:hypothetical protein
MTDVYEWLKNVHQSSYAPTSSSLMAPPASSLEPMDGILAEDNPMDQIMPLDIDKDDNMYFDMPHAWNAPFEQSQTNVESIPIDPSRGTVTDPLASTTPRAL